MTLRAATAQVGCMPSMKRMKQDGRADLAKLVRKHGGQRVLAARLNLTLHHPRRERMNWGPFDLDFAIDLLNVSQVVAVDESQSTHRRVLLPTNSQLSALGRQDLDCKIELYGGRHDVARRLGMDVDAHEHAAAPGWHVPLRAEGMRDSE